MYLWINYALYEELEAEAAERTREVYRAALDILPHKTFTFAKLWLLFAQFEIRQRNLTAARKILVRALAFSLVKSPYPVTKLGGGGGGGILESPCLSVCLFVMCPLHYVLHKTMQYITARHAKVQYTSHHCTEEERK